MSYREPQCVLALKHWVNDAAFKCIEARTNARISVANNCQNYAWLLSSLICVLGSNKSKLGQHRMWSVSIQV